MSDVLELPLGDTKPEIVKDSRRFDWINRYCSEKFGTPEGWRWYSWSRKEFDKPHEFMIVEGAVCTAKIERGKRKGQDDWRKRDKSTERTFSISRKDLDAFCVEWQAKTGNCWHCYGTGQDWAGWSAAEGTRYKPCRHCKATGRSVSSGERSDG